ncbi:DUF4430 domain-containing protein [Aquibacillus halophilus]|uniref:DUF4430 domain-containing protein n=1 Tax=Aquibacillus halophilus TaxID=930132 RepID=A0A6A8DAM1_9BACI|nr:DUF4430 domain-containing protein [Aquibacillus halophilus]MRH42360.1 DUF4430 domain-containing protein [Aquibacillus halophilus]
MKKFYLSILSLLFTVMVLSGCGQEDSNADQNETNQSEQAGETENQEKVVITISQDKGEEVITEEEISFEEGAVLMDVMVENFEVEGADQGFITSIEGIGQNEEEGKYWLYDVNGEMPTVGANEYELQPGDEITFDLQATE